MLLQEWQKAEDTGRLPSVEDIQAALGNHVDKQRKALLGLSFSGQEGSALEKVLRITMKPQNPGYKEANKIREDTLERLAKRTPDDRHMRRMSALYVDLKESGVDWNRPLHISEGDAWKLLTDAANDYAGEFNRMDPDFLRAMANPKLADALEAWHGRPDLPQPVWPDDR